MGGFGAWRLARTPTRLVDGVHLRIMQPNLQQDIRFNYAAKQEVMNRYIALSDRASGPQSLGRARRDASDLAGIAISLLPHARSRRARANHAALAARHRADHRRDAACRAGQSGRIRSVYNSIYVIDHDGSILALYDKVHLVPFGEYLPFEHFLERLGLQELTKQRGGFLAGDRRRLIAIPGAPVALPLICYEIIFPTMWCRPATGRVDRQRHQ